MSNRRIRNFIGGDYVDTASGRTFEDRNPANNALVALVDEAGEAEVDAAVSAARAALAGDWGRAGVLRRAAALRKVAGGIMARAEEFVAAEMADTGKLKGMTSAVEIPRAAEQFRVFADIAEGAQPDTVEMATPDGGTAVNHIQRQPKGVVAAICPWNLPLILATWKVAPALAAGNAVVIKPSEETPATATLLADVMNEAGIPAGVYNVVHGFGADSAGAFLVRHPGVDAITFTGETNTGSAIMQAAARGLRDVSLELGGKNPGIVFADCDFDSTVAGAAASSFVNCGQMCLGTERWYVERPIFHRFVEALKDKAEALRPGDPGDRNTTLSPLISLQHRKKVLSYYARAAADGAEIVSGGGTPAMTGEWAGGAWVQPTVWTGLGQGAAAVREEIFGPCCHVMPFDGEEESVALANDSDYGLTATVWTRDLSRARRVAGQLEVGVCWVNSWMLRDLRTPFGGFKTSGIGREGGTHSLEFYSELKNICVRT